MRKVKCVIAAVLVAAFCAIAVPPAVAQGRSTPRDWSKWDSVQRLIGKAVIESGGGIDRSEVNDEEHNKFHDLVTIVFELERVRPNGVWAGSTHWEAVRVHVEGQSSSSRSSESNTSRQHYSASGSYSQNLKYLGDFDVGLIHETGEWQATTPAKAEPYEMQVTGSYWTAESDTTERYSETELSTSMPAYVFDGQADRDIGVLQASGHIEFHEEDGSGGHWTTARITIQPDWNDVEVIVIIDGYERWRPLASLTMAGGEGNHLLAQAVLRPKDVSAEAALPEVESFHFELLETSQVPGAAMNWPLDSTDDSPDLMLRVETSSPGVLKNKSQQLDVPNPARNARGWPAATARIGSFDFGGRTILRVTAELADGRTIVGRLEGQEDTPYPGILIPKRRPGRWIAEAWLADNGVAKLPDDDDAESEPEGDGHDGDGLTLYEEYRGFVVGWMKGGRAEGDPKRKDLFILNLTRSRGADGSAGIDLFEKATGLRVIQSRDKREMDEEKRVINMNHGAAKKGAENEGAAPHRVDQHGVVLKTLDFDQMNHHGAMTFEVKGRDASYALKPATTRVVGIPARNDKESLFNKPFNLPADDFATMLDRVIVHELLHSVGVGEHGSNDHNAEFLYVPASYKGNNRGEPVFWMKSGQDWSQYIDVLEEATGESLAKRMSPLLDYQLDLLCDEFADTLEVPPGTKFADLDEELQKIVIQLPPIFNLYVGVEHGEHSGNEQCPMRYAFADLYKAQKGFVPREIYYVVPLGTEDVGVTVCDSPVGTGVNDAGHHKPQSRYGDAEVDASGHFGNCAAQICVNDGAPPRKRGCAK